MGLSRALLLVALVLAFGTSSISQNTTEKVGQISIIQDDQIDSLLQKHLNINHTQPEIDGYRIQIMFSNERAEAYKEKAAVYRAFPDLKPYVIYDQPYYKLRVGDFGNRLDATRYLHRVVERYQGAYLVKDQVDPEHFPSKE